MGKTLVESNTGVNTEGTETPASRRTEGTGFLNTEGTETPASRRTEGTEGRSMQSMALPGILH